MRMMLVPLDGSRPIPLEKAIVFFGRSADCDVVLTSSRKVSRKHCCIAQIDDHFLVRDLGSMNGVRINSDPIKEEGRINSGDEIWIGDVGFRFAPYNAAAFKQAERDETAGGRHQAGGKPKPVIEAIDPAQLSQDIPVAIPDGARPAREKPKRPGTKTPRERRVSPFGSDDDIIELSEEDIIDD